MKVLFRKIKRMLTVTMCCLLVFEVVNCSAMLVNAEGNVMNALFYILKPGVEKPSEDPIKGQPQELFSEALNGTVYVNGNKLEEPYLTEKSLEPCDIEFPYQVPENKYFVMGDSRTVSIDSRSSAVGCISQEQIVGNIVFRVWPISDFGNV